MLEKKQLKIMGSKLSADYNGSKKKSVGFKCELTMIVFTLVKVELSQQLICL